MIMSGNVQVSPTHLSLGRDIILPEDIDAEALKPYEKLASKIHGTSTSKPLAILQLNHSGRQAANFLGGSHPFRPPKAPSAVRVSSKDASWITSALYCLLFAKPDALSLPEIDQVVEAFARGALLASKAGFDGVEIHAAHGCETFLFLCLGFVFDTTFRPHRSVHFSKGVQYI
jgi:2,4-dienoyl-CoA reductase-like NADH-dependent reductase (Old Yellow Enzyme family)